MSRISHIGYWPFKSEVGTGPITRNDSPGVGSGVREGTITPGVVEFPFGYTLAGAMRQFWKIKVWNVRIRVIGAGIDVDFNDELRPSPWSGGAGPEILVEQGLVPCHDGIVYHRERTIGSFRFEAQIYVAAVFTVGEVQVYFDPGTGLWIPKINFRVHIDDSVEGYTIEFANDGTFGGGPDEITGSYEGEPITMYGSTQGGAAVTITATVQELWPQAS